MEDMLEKIKAAAAALKARDPKNIVFEYSGYVELGKAIILNRSGFEDGRHRIVLHPDMRSRVEEALATLTD